MEKEKRVKRAFDEGNVKRKSIHRYQYNAILKMCLRGTYRQTIWKIDNCTLNRVDEQ